MTTSAVRVGVGTHFAYDGEVVEVVGEQLLVTDGADSSAKPTRR